jgi:serine/threonine protein kinase
VGTPTSSGLRFRVLRPHARGGLGEVHVALDEELGREVALKQIQARYADDPTSRARFLLEAEITGRLEHPGIVPVYGLGSYEDGRPYYAMRFVRGDSLEDGIRHFHEAEKSARSPGDRALELRQLLGRFVAVCNAIASAHSRGILHRDLKPGNVMLGQYGETLVKEFPEKPGYVPQLGCICNDLGNLIRAGGSPEHALTWYGRTITALYAVFGGDPPGGDARRDPRGSHENRANALMKLSRDAEAFRDWGRADELDAGLDRLRCRLWRDFCLARVTSGGYDGVVSRATALAKTKAVSGFSLYDAARVCALASADGKVESERKDRYVAGAVELLTHAGQVGYFKDPTKIDHLKKDNDISALRPRDDFKKLLADLETKVEQGK